VVHLQAAAQAHGIPSATGLDSPAIVPDIVRVTKGASDA
jgi:hypothetical protein